MKGNATVIEHLNQILTNELTAINQYFVHSKLCEDWGYQGLAGTMRNESIDEMRHADQIMDRILYLDGMPNLQRLGKVNVGQSVPEQMKLDLALEMDAVAYLNETIKVCAEANDNGSLELVKAILVSEEAHIDWIEEQISLIENIGLQNYLAQQLNGPSANP
jgi:bacterioferritin